MARRPARPEPRPDDRGGWEAWVPYGRTPQGRPRRKHVRAGTREECQQKIDEIMATSSLFGDDYIRPGRPITVAEWAKEFLEQRRPYLADKTWRNYEGTLRLHVLPFIGHVQLSAVTVSDMYALDRSHPMTDPVRDRCRLVTSLILTEATRQGLLKVNPMTLVRFPPVKLKEAISFTPQQVQAILDEVDASRDPAMWRVAIFTGLRVGELLALRWEDVDLERRVITVRSSRQAYRWAHGCTPLAPCPGGGRSDACPQRIPLDQFKETKTRRSRQVGITADLVDELVTHRRRQVRKRLAAGDEWVELGLVFPSRTGDLRHPSTLRESWKRLLQRAGVDYAKPHTMRHTAKTLMVEAGVDPAVAIQQFGWSSQNMGLPPVCLTVSRRWVRRPGWSSGGLFRTLLG